MSAALLHSVFRHGALALLALAGPALIAAAVVGLLVGFLQALLNLQDQALPFVIKLGVIILVLAATAFWSLNYAATWTHHILVIIAGV